MARGKEGEPQCVIRSFNKSLGKLFPSPGNERRCDVAISNLVHKLEELTRVGVIDVSTERSDRTEGGNEGEQVCPPSEHP